MKAPQIQDEAGRLAALRAFNILDSAPEPEFTDLAELAAEICAAPIALITLVDERRQWFKARVGFAQTETPRDDAFCAHTIAGRDLLVVPDTAADPRFADGALVRGEPHVRFYAGAPLVTRSGHAIGSMCVMDRAPRQLTDSQRRALRILARQVVTELELRGAALEQARTREALAASEERWQFALEGSELGVWDWNLLTNQVFFSRRWCTMLGYTPEEITPVLDEWSKRVHPDDLPPALAQVREHLEGRTPVYVSEHRMRARDGSWVWVLDRGKVLARDADGRPLRMVGTHTDITARKAVEAEVAEARRRLETLVGNLPGVVYRCRNDEVWTMEFISDGIRELSGYGPIHFAPGGERSFYDLVHPDDLVRVADEVRAAVVARRPFEVTYRLRRADGQTRWVAERGEGLVEPDGQVRYLEGFILDVTDQREAQNVLREREENFRRIFQDAAIGIAITDLQPRLLEANAAYCRMLGYTEEELRAADFRTITHPEDRESSRALFEDLVAGRRESAVHEKRYLTKDGRVVWGRISLSVQRDAAGRPSRVIGVAEDVTAIRTAVEALSESEERFRLLARATNDAVWDWDITADRVWWNEGYVGLFGHEQTEGAAADVWSAFIHPEDAPRVLRGISAALESGAEWKDEYRFRHRDGHYMTVLDRGQVIRDSAGRAVRMVGGMTDLTERHRAEAKLREQAALLDTAHDAICVRDCEHRITYWNRGAERVYGWTAAEAIGRRFDELLKVDAERFAAADAAVRATGAWNGEILKTAKDGTVHVVDGSWSLQRDAAGRPIAILTIDADITARRNLEQQFLRAQRMESIGTLAGGIAHDLNNLLAPIMMSIELLRINEPHPKSQQLIENMERSARRGAALVKQVLSFARGVEGARVAVQLRHVLRELETIIENTFPRNITLRVEIPDGIWPVIGDPTQLNQVLLNLCVNARDAMPEGGTLRIVVTNLEVDEQYAVFNRGVAAGRYVRVEVVDTGTGIPPDIVDRIFDPFFTTKQVGQGTGLGLSTVLGIVRSHGGFVNVYSEVGHGSTFKVYLPAQAEAAEPAEEETAAGRLPRGHNELVLVVDDEPPILNVTRQTLESFGYRVITAEDGAQAIGLYATQRDEIAVVLTDMMMPVMNGVALIAALRRINPQVRIIAASGLGANADIARATQSGVKHFLAKPYAADALLLVLHRALATDSRPPV